MARGPGMTIDEDKAAVQPTGIGTGQVRGFSADIPKLDTSAQINAGAKIQNLGEELMQLVGQKSARDAAYAAPLEFDPVTQKYKRPDAGVMGLVTADTYNKIVDQRMTEQVVHDYESHANEITAKHFNDPETAGALLSKLRESTLKAVDDPRMQGLIQGHLDREGLERLRGVQTYAARQQWQNEVNYLNQSEQMNTDKALGFLQIGDEHRAMEANALAESARARRVEMGSDDKRELDLADVRWTTMKNAATVLNRVEHELETNPERIPDTIRRLDAMLRAGGSDEDEVLGFTKQGLMTKIGSQTARDQLAARLQRTLGDYQLKAQQAATTTDPAVFENFYRANPRSGKNHNWTEAQENQMVQGYIQQKFGPDGAYKGATVEHLWQLTGRVPDFYKGLFERARGQSPMALANLAEVYDTINGLKDSAGNTVGAGGQVLNDNDAAFMKVFRDAYHMAPANPNDPPEKQKLDRALYAKKEAVELYDKGIDKLSEAKGVGGYAAVVNRELEAHGKTRMDTDKMVADAKSKFGTVFTNGGAVDLSTQNAQEIVRGIAARMAQGNYSYEKARDESVQRFQETHYQSDFIISPMSGKPGGWVAKEYAVPKLDNLQGGAQTDAWVKLYVTGRHPGEGIFALKDTEGKPLINPVQRGQKIENPELGVNVFMIPKGVSTENPQFSLVYKDQGGNLIPLQNQKGADVLIRTGAEAKRQASEISKRFLDPEYKRVQEDRERALIINQAAASNATANNLAPEPVGLPPGIAPAPVDPTKILDPVVYGETGEPNMQQTKNTRGGGGGKALSYPRRRDGMTDPMTDLPYPDPNAPGRKAGNVSLEEPGTRGFRIPGLDGPTHLVAVARDENTRFFVTNQSGPRAGERVTIHPDFAAGLASMVESMPKEVRAEFKIGSAVRSFDQQEGIYRAAVAKRGDSARMWAAPPGHSNHEHGIAADLAMGPAAKAWVHANAGRFGLWFPMKHEPWHIEPIGSRQRADAGSDTEAT